MLPNEPTQSNPVPYPPPVPNPSPGPDPRPGPPPTNPVGSARHRWHGDDARGTAAVLVGCRAGRVSGSLGKDFGLPCIMCCRRRRYCWRRSGQSRQRAAERSEGRSPCRSSRWTPHDRRSFPARRRRKVRPGLGWSRRRVRMAGYEPGITVDYTNQGLLPLISSRSICFTRRAR
jgi:hypothetical protein